MFQVFKSVKDPQYQQDGYSEKEANMFAFTELET